MNFSKCRFVCRLLVVAFGVALLPALTMAQEAERITHDGLIKISPQFIEGGGAIVYSVYDDPYKVNFSRLNLADGKSEHFLPTMPSHQFGGLLSNDGKYLAYIRSLSNPQLELVIVDLAAKTESKFGPRGGRATARNPSFAPDNRRVVFASSGGSYGQQIATVNLQCKEFTLLTDSSGINTSPVYSPDGKHIAFGSSRDGDLEIYVMTSNGSNQKRLTKSARLDTHPAWSPDGKRIAFTSARDGNYEIYVMNADGSQQVNVTRHGEKDDFATWHPDGKRLLFVGERKGRFDLYIITVPEVVASRS